MVPYRVTTVRNDTITIIQDGLPNTLSTSSTSLVQIEQRPDATPQQDIAPSTNDTSQNTPRP